MQDLDNSLATYLKRGLLGAKMESRQGRGQAPPSWIPVAHDVTRRAAAKLDGDPRAYYSTSSTDRPQRISSAVARSETHQQPALSIPTSGSMGIPAYTSSMVQPSRPTSAPTPRSPSRQCRNERSPSGPTRVSPTRVLHSAPPISGFRPSRRAIRSCRKPHRRRFAYRRSDRRRVEQLPGYQMLTGCFGAGGCAAGTLQP
jgi:hypothetical protein